mmetsp:Transcript_26269/g.66252  ORF Transcript_26269/g.66252 Transcript_26269/m.66252 type:complete len:235 (-) Transcript_26269:1913-2617(-)
MHDAAAGDDEALALGLVPHPLRGPALFVPDPYVHLFQHVADAVRDARRAKQHLRDLLPGFHLRHHAEPPQKKSELLVVRHLPLHQERLLHRAARPTAQNLQALERRLRLFGRDFAAEQGKHGEGNREVMEEALDGVAHRLQPVVAVVGLRHPLLRLGHESVHVFRVPRVGQQRRALDRLLERKVRQVELVHGLLSLVVSIVHTIVQNRNLERRHRNTHLCQHGYCHGADAHAAD